MTLVLVAAPAAPPITTADAKAHLRVTSSDDDAYIAALVDVARLYLEGRNGILGRALITQTWDYKTDRFPCFGPFHIPLAPLQSVTHIKYIDTNGDVQTLSSDLYAVDADSAPSRIQPAYGHIWPATREDLHAVTVRGIFGYGAAASSIPAGIIQAMKLLISHWYENREPVQAGSMSPIPFAVDALLAPHRIRSFA